MDPDELNVRSEQRWDSLVAGGMSPEEATANVQRWRQHQERALEFRAEADEIRATEGRPGMLEGGVRAGVQGLTFGFGDELVAGARALPRLAPGGESFGESYGRNVEEERAGLSAFREDHPVVSTVSEIGGAVLPAVAAAPLAAGSAATAGTTGATRLGLGRLAAAGAAEGALAGAGSAEGGLVERAEGAAKGAAVGGLTGAALPVAGRGVGGMFRRFLDATGMRPRTSGSMAAGLIDSVEDRATARLGDALPDDGQEIARLGQTLRDTDRPMTLMDVDPNVAGVARAARGVEGPAKRDLPDFLAQRVAGQEERILDDAFRLSAQNPDVSLADTMDDIIQRRAAQAEEQYGAIRDIPVPVEGLEDLLNRPSFKDAYRRAAKVAADEGSPIPSLEALLEAGDTERTIPLGVLDRVKQGLDGLIETGRGRSLDAAGERAIIQAKNQYLSILDGLVPEYAAARSAFAGESALLDAAEQGRRLFKMGPAEASRVLRDMGDSEREMFVRGGLEELQTRMGNVASSHDQTARGLLADKTNNQKRLRLLFPSDEAFEEFKVALAEEARIASTNRFVTGGSNTAEKLMEMFELGGVSLPSLASGNVTGLLAGLANSALRRRGQGFTSRVGEELMPSLTATGGEAADVLDRVTRVRQEVGARLARQDAALAGVAGATSGSATNRR